MKLKLIKPVAVAGLPLAKLGETIEVKGGDAIYLIALGAAVEVLEQAPEVIQTREPVVENRDPGTQPLRQPTRKLSKSSLP